MKKAIILGAVLFLLPFKVNAASATLSLSCPEVVSPNQEVSCTLSATTSGGALAGITADYVLGSNVSYSNIVLSSGWNEPVHSISILNVYNSLGSTGTFNIATIKINIGNVVAGSSLIFGLKINKAFDIDSNKVDIANNNLQATMKTASASNDLSSLSITNGTLSPAFIPSVTNYSATTASSSLVISAVLADARTTFVSGSGPRTVNINYGANAFFIKVKAENGAIKTYTITINRTDNRSNVNTLSSLTISDTSLNFSSNTLSYSITVEHSINNVTINAIPTDSKAKVIGVGFKNLKDGLNSFDIKVTAENGSIKTYNLKITRKNSKGGTTPLADNNNLKSLSIEGISFFFSKSINYYTLAVNNNVTEVKFNYEVEDSKATAALSGETKLTEGDNEIKIVVTAENGQEKAYSFLIKRNFFTKEVKNEKQDIINALKEVNFITVKLNLKDKPIIDQDIINQIVMKNQEIEFIFLENTETVYKINLNRASVPKLLSNTYLINREKIANEALDNLNSAAKIVYLNVDEDANILYLIKVNEDYKDGTNLYLYENNSTEKKLGLLNGSLVVKDNFVNVSIGDYKNYILSDQLLTNNNGSNTITKKSNLSIIVIAESIIIVAAIVGGMVLIKKIKPKNNGIM